MDSSRPTSTSSTASPLPEGTVPVAIGLLIAGIGIYAFFKVGTWAVGGKEQFEPISSLWFATFALSPGFFLPLEQELGRAISARRSLGLGARPVVAKVRRLGFGLAAIVILAVLALSPLITPRLFNGDAVMLLCMVLAFASYAPAHIVRGITSGSARFRDYAIVMGADGVIRIVLCLALVAVGVSAIGWFGVIVAIAPLFGVMWVWRRGALHTDDGPPASWSEVTPNLGWLLLGSVFSAALVNAGPVTVKVLSNTVDADLIVDFNYGVLLARIPLFLFQAVQAALLPRLSRHAARDEIAEFRVGLRKLIMVVVGVGIVGTSGAFLLGPLLLEQVFDASLSGRTMAMLAVGTAFYMMALAMAQAVIALKGYALVAVGWCVGMITFVTTTWLASDQLFRRVEIGLVASSVAAMVAFGVALSVKLGRGVTPTAASLRDALTDMPLET